jgi:hypothetical protein
MNPSAWAFSRDLVAVDGVDALWKDGKVDGFPTFATPHLAETTENQGDVIFGDWAKGLILAYFGSLDLLVDPYSLAGTGQIALHLNRFYDVEVRQAGAFASIKDVT